MLFTKVFDVLTKCFQTDELKKYISKSYLTKKVLYLDLDCGTFRDCHFGVLDISRQRYRCHIHGWLRSCEFDVFMWGGRNDLPSFFSFFRCLHTYGARTVTVYEMTIAVSPVQSSVHSESKSLKTIFRWSNYWSLNFKILNNEVVLFLRL